MSKAREVLVLDRGMIGFLIIILALGGSWARMELGVKANTDGLAGTNMAIADVKLAYIKADGVVASLHSTQFRRLELNVGEVRRDVTQQAISMGKIEAGVTYIVNSIEGARR